MSTTTQDAPATGTRDRQVRLRMPAPRGPFAPITARRMGRAVAAYAAVWCVGLLPTLLGAGAAPRALGLGLLLPGGGFWLTGSVPAALASAAVLVLAVSVWWATGPTVLPPLVLLATAGLAAVAAPGDDRAVAVPVAAAVPLVLLLAVAVHVVRHRRQTATARALDRRLASAPVTVTGPPPLEQGRPVAESSAEDLARLRYALDLALQPVDAFAGFTTIDQYREAATRYQVNALGYALSLAQSTRTPAFSGYLAEAQRGAIEKLRQRRVWSYWARENAWGNLRWDPDPIGTPENIMLTGFLGAMVGMYGSLNDDRYARPGSLTFRWDDERTYVHDFGTLAARVHENALRSPYGLIACEPNWVYAICNTFALNTLLTHDRLHGTSYDEDAGERIRHSYETEFTRPDGRMIGVRASHLGLSWNFWAGEAAQLPTAFWLHASAPELALRSWWLMRERTLRVEDGRVVLPRAVGARLDPGNYRLGRDTFAQTVALMAAREVGDEEVAGAAERSLAERERIATQDGAERWADASGLANLYGLLGRFGRRSGMRDLLAFDAPDAWRTGPILADAAYPDVLVARAVTDGHALDLVLRPGAGPVRATLAVERLRPGARYAVRGTAGPEVVVADPGGRAVVEVDLHDRLEVRLAPA